MVKISNIKVDYINHMGDDLSVVNAARVSFHKVSNKFNDKDEKLIKYLANHNHWTPFGHTSLSLRIKAPLFVSRQLVKHGVGGVINEVSRRYVDTEPEFYFPDEWRLRANNKKQGSSDDIHENNDYICLKTRNIIKNNILPIYEELLEMGICPEQARMMLPLNCMTEWIWTGSIAFFARVCNLRLEEHSQKETQDVAKLILPYMQEYFPVSTKALIKVNHG